MTTRRRQFSHVVLLGGALSLPWITPIMLRASQQDDGRLEAAQPEDAARFLTPRRLRLSYRDTPLLEALADFQKKSGCSLILHDPDHTLARRRLTLDTGEVTFWEALDRFCAKAGLVEVEPVAPPENQPVLYLGFMVYAPSAASGGGKSIAAPENSSSEPIMLRALQQGDGRLGAAHYIGPFRLRILSFAKTNKKKGAGLALSLELAAQSGFGIAKIVDVRVDQAVDDQGRNLRQLSDQTREVDAAMEELLRMQKGLLGGMERKIINADAVHDKKYAKVRVQFQRGGRESQSLKKATGAVFVQVLPPAEAWVPVPDVFQAAGRRVEGERGAAVKVVEAMRHADGRVRLHLELTAPDGMAKAKEDFSLFLLGPLGKLSLEDAKGGFPPESFFVQERDRGKPAVRELWATFHPAAGRRPTKLVFSGRRDATLQIPFVLKDAPLK